MIIGSQNYHAAFYRIQNSIFEFKARIFFHLYTTLHIFHQKDLNALLSLKFIDCFLRILHNEVLAVNLC